MNYVNENQAVKDAQSIEAAILLMCELAKPVISDGINLSISDLFSIAIGRKSLASIYQKEAENRSASLPTYRKEQEISEAVSRSNTYQKQVNDLRNYMILAKFKLEQFNMDENCTISFVGDLKKACIQNNTITLSPKHENLVKGIEVFKKALNQFNDLLSEVGTKKLSIEIPFVWIDSPDLKAISNINFEAIEENKKAIQRQIKLDIEKKEAIRKKIENIVPKDFPNREEEISRFINFELTEERPEGFYRGLISNSQTNYKTKGVTPIGMVYDNK
jgi:hypothetical protein